MLNKTADEAWGKLNLAKPPFIDYRDASFGPCTYKCTILHILRGLECSIKLGWFDWRSFNLKDYELYEKVENGDFNWIIPNKLLAFSGPSASPYDTEGWRTFTPEDYSPLFKKMGITNVVRLNKKQYDASRFTKLGILLDDLYFIDGSPPPEEIILKFLEIVENAKGAVAVHCKAGLGRTGSLIACYAMKHYKFPAAEFIGFVRLMRPGSVLGP